MASVPRIADAGQTSQAGRTVSRWAHNPEISGATPEPATKHWQATHLQELAPRRPSAVEIGGQPVS